MALTVNSASDSGRVPKQPMMAGTLNVDADATYAAGGYDVSASLPDGVTVFCSPWVPSYDGSALYWMRIEMVSGVPRLKIYDNGSGAPGTETSTADQSGHTGVTIDWIGY